MSQTTAATVAHANDHALDHGDHAHGHHPTGLMRWLTTTNHKDIGTMYLWFSFTMFLMGGVLALGIRAELFKPGLQLWHPEFFNQLTTMHGIIMVFGAIMPAFVGFANWLVPIQIGAPDMAFARKPLFGYSSMVYATSSIAILSFIVWAHHMFVVGMPAAGVLFFMYATVLIAVPTGVKVFNWLATMWRGSMTFETPMLFAVGFLFVFTMGGFTGLVCAIAPIDLQIQDTYYVVAHFHYVLVAGSLFALFSGTYFWLPKWTGHMYNEAMGKTHFWLSLIFFNITFFPMHFLGLAGMPRRIPDYATQFADFNMIASIGAFGFGFSQLIFLAAVVKCIRGGEKATAQVWEGAEGLEWTLPSPAPYHSFEVPPQVK